MNDFLCKFKKFCCNVGNVQLKSDYHVKLSLYNDEKCEYPACSHSANGSSKCSLIKVIAAISATLLLVSILHDIYYFIKFKK